MAADSKYLGAIRLLCANFSRYETLRDLEAVLRDKVSIQEDEVKAAVDVLAAIIQNKEELAIFDDILQALRERAILAELEAASGADRSSRPGTAARDSTIGGGAGQASSSGARVSVPERMSRPFLTSVTTVPETQPVHAQQNQGHVQWPDAPGSAPALNALLQAGFMQTINQVLDSHVKAATGDSLGSDGYVQKGWAPLNSAQVFVEALEVASEGLGLELNFGPSDPGEPGLSAGSERA